MRIEFVALVNWLRKIKFLTIELQYVHNLNLLHVYVLEYVYSFSYLENNFGPCSINLKEKLYF